ncbi:ferredoxin family protein [Bradyrhizobium betae]|uniref:Ferredoxin n=1 Tax=Bradyrhizobium betae TaxID=244734 RepID=A0A5P6PG16_9BRAD|nr:ferredoxin family protein [Bradyrhizobium betae]
MTHVVTDNCIKCKYMDCVEVCPVDCFYVGENMLVIHPDECIDCGVCVPECPAEAIFPDGDIPPDSHWLGLNRKYAGLWPNIVAKGTPPPDADVWNGVTNKFSEHFSSNPEEGAGAPGETTDPRTAAEVAGGNRPNLGATKGDL